MRANEGNSRDCTPAEKSDPGYASLPRYWVAEREVLARIADVPRGVANAWLSGDGEKLVTEVGLWLIGHLRINVGDGSFLSEAETLTPELARAALKAKTRWEKAKSDAEAFPMPEDLFGQLGKTRGEAALIELLDEWMDRLSPRWLMGWRDICR